MALWQNRFWAIYIFSFTSRFESNSASIRSWGLQCRTQRSFFHRMFAIAIATDTATIQLFDRYVLSQNNTDHIGCNMLNPLIGTRYETTAVLDLEQTKSKIDAQIGQPCTITHAHSHINKGGIGEFKLGATMVVLFCESVFCDLNIKYYLFPYQRSSFLINTFTNL
jgi:hypothetical protein